MLTDNYQTPQAILPDAAARPSRLRAAVDGFVRWRRSNQQRQAAIVRTVGASFLVFALTVVQGVFVARILGPEARGEYGTSIFYAQALLYIGLLGTPLSIARRAAQPGCDPLLLRNASLRLGLLTGLATSALVMVLALFALPAEKRHLAPLCMACALMLPWEQMRLSVLSVDHGRGMFTRYNTSRLVAAAIFPLLLFAAWLTQTHSLTVVALLTIAVPIIGLGFHLATGESGSVLGPAAPTPRTLLREGLPHAFAIVVGNLYGRLDSLLMLWLAELTVQGYYAAAVPAAGLLGVAPSALALFSFNAGARRDRPCTMRQVGLAGATVLALQTVTGGLFALVLGPLITLVYGKEFRGATPFALALLPAHALCGCVVVIEGYLRGRGKPAAGAFSHLISMPVMAVVVFLLYGEWHELSIPMGYTAAQATSAIWMVYALVQDVRGGEFELPLEAVLP